MSRLFVHIGSDARTALCEAFDRATTSIDAEFYSIDDRDVIASLNDTTMYNYDVGFPSAGHWVEVFNSDVYDNWVNPTVEGNGGGVEATGAPLHGFEASCAIVLPAKAVIVFARDQGD